MGVEVSKHAHYFHQSPGERVNQGNEDFWPPDDPILEGYAQIRCAFHLNLRIVNGFPVKGPNVAQHQSSEFCVLFQRAGKYVPRYGELVSVIRDKPVADPSDHVERRYQVSMLIRYVKRVKQPKGLVFGVGAVERLQPLDHGLPVGMDAPQQPGSGILKEYLVGEYGKLRPGVVRSSNLSTQFGQLPSGVIECASSIVDAVSDEQPPLLFGDAGIHVDPKDVLRRGVIESDGHFVGFRVSERAGLFFQHVQVPLRPIEFRPCTIKWVAHARYSGDTVDGK